MSAVPLPKSPLATDRLVLRNWHAEDAAALFEAFHDPDVLRFSWSSSTDYTRADAARYLQEREPARQRGEAHGDRPDRYKRCRVSRRLTISLTEGEDWGTLGASERHEAPHSAPPATLRTIPTHCSNSTISGF